MNERQSSIPPAWRAEHYDRASIALHWASAILIGINWMLGQGFSFIPRGSPRTDVVSTHMLIGLSVGLMLLARLAWRAGPGRRLAAEPGLLGLAAKTLHGTLYAVIGATVLAGLSAALSHGFHLYGASILPRLDFWPRGPLFQLSHWHGKLADLLIILAGLHALAALWHHAIQGDAILLRMAPFLPSGLRPPRYRSRPNGPDAAAPGLAPPLRDS
ncbi:MAG TPA: cytochrome b/b6 domain-containing protein [Acetobacteraceae bacterium]|nr:cytochrome b/b6 domain-containing protein [Acetobacteraceae bacterium]